MSSILKIPKNQIRSRNTIEQSEHEDALHARRVVLVDYLGELYTPTNRLPVDAVVSIDPGAGVTTPKIVNIPIALANTEYSYAFPSETAWFTIKARESNVIIKYAWEVGKSGTEYITIRYGQEKTIDTVNLTSKTLYFQLNKPGMTIEIESWS